MNPYPVHAITERGSKNQFTGDLLFDSLFTKSKVEVLQNILKIPKKLPVLNLVLGDGTLNSFQLTVVTLSQLLFIALQRRISTACTSTDCYCPVSIDICWLSQLKHQAT